MRGVHGVSPALKALRGSDPDSGGCAGRVGKGHAVYPVCRSVVGWSGHGKVRDGLWSTPQRGSGARRCACARGRGTRARGGVT